MIPQQLRDWLHEREIARLSRRCREAMESGDRVKASSHFQAMRRAISERSPEQVARMERSQGMR